MLLCALPSPFLAEITLMRVLLWWVRQPDPSLNALFGE